MDCSSTLEVQIGANRHTCKPRNKLKHLQFLHFVNLYHVTRLIPRVVNAWIPGRFKGVIPIQQDMESAVLQSTANFRTCKPGYETPVIQDDM